MTKMHVPEFCAFLCNEGYCDDIDCQSCPIDKLMLENINFEIKSSPKPIEKKKGEK
jgi:hypothetical protein